MPLSQTSLLAVEFPAGESAHELDGLKLLVVVFAHSDQEGYLAKVSAPSTLSNEVRVPETTLRSSMYTPSLGTLESDVSRSLNRTDCPAQGESEHV